MTVLIFLIVTGVVLGCDSDDTPTVTAPSGGSGSGTPTRNMTAEQQGRDGLKETDNGSMIRNTGEVALNVRFNYETPRHYRLNAGTAMPSNPASADSAPTRVACGVPATGRANGQCFDNDGVPAPEPYSSNGGGGGSGGGPPIVAHPDQIATSCIQQGSLRGNPTVRNSCGTPIVAQVVCGEGDNIFTSSRLRPVIMYETLENARRASDALSRGDRQEQARLRREGLDAYAVDDEVLRPGEDSRVVCSASKRIVTALACYLREEGLANSAYIGHPWYAYAPTFGARDSNASWNCFIRDRQVSVVQ